MTGKTALITFSGFGGGESLYLQHMSDEAIGGVLRSVGEPCIVEAALGTEHLSDYRPVGYRLLRSFLAHRCGDEHEGWEEHVKQPVSANQIRRIVERSDPLFETLTACSTWEEPLA